MRVDFERYKDVIESVRSSAFERGGGELMWWWGVGEGKDAVGAGASAAEAAEFDEHARWA